MKPDISYRQVHKAGKNSVCRLFSHFLFIDSSDFQIRHRDIHSEVMIFPHPVKSGDNRKKAPDMQHVPLHGLFRPGAPPAPDRKTE